METNCEDIVENIEHRETRRTGEHEETLTVCCSLRRIIKNIEHRETGRKRGKTLTVRWFLRMTSVRTMNNRGKSNK